MILKSKQAVLAALALVCFAFVLTLAAYGYWMIHGRIYGAQKMAIEYEKLQSEQSSLKDKLSELMLEYDRLVSENQNLKTVENKFEEEKKAILDQIQASVSTYDKERQSAAQQIMNLRKEMDALNGERAQLEKQLSELREKSASDKISLNDQVEKLSTQVTAYEDELKKLTSEIKGIEEARRVPAVLHYNLGNFYFKNLRYEDAIVEYRKSLEYIPEDPDTHYNMAVTFDDFLKEPLNALEHYRRFVALRPDGDSSNTARQRILDLESQQAVKSDKPMDFNGLTPLEQVRKSNFSIAKDK